MKRFPEDMWSQPLWIGTADKRNSGSADQRTSGPAHQRISRPADQRISGSADQRISGSADQRISGSADQRISGSADQRISGPADQRISGSADQRISGSADQRTSGSADQRISGSADQRISGSADQRTSGSADQRTSGSADQRISGPADQRISGPADQRISGSADQRIRQPSGHKSQPASFQGDLAGMNPSEESHIWIKLGLEATCKMEELLRESKEEWNLSPQECDDLWSSAIQFMACNSALEKHFAKGGQCLFKHNTFKHHWLLHSCRQAGFFMVLLGGRLHGQDEKTYAQLPFWQSCTLFPAPVHGTIHFGIEL